MLGSMDVGRGLQRRAYEYEPFREGGMVRLLELLPNGSPTVRILQVKLSEAPRYAALSYTWGENIFDHDLHVEGSVLRITKNLSDAFIQLAPFIRQQGLKLWVDAVCINQKDLGERGDQVSFMDKIYKSSDQVLVWLGKSDTESDLAMDAISRWNDKISDMRQGDTRWESKSWAIDQVTSGDSEVWGPAGSAPARAWLAILSLWERPWWRRAWIVQEATALPIDRTILCCGSRKISLNYMRFVLDIRYKLFMNNSGNDLLISTFEQGFADLLDQLSHRLAEGERSLLPLLKRVRTYDCQDQRDKVFAVISMASDVPRGAIQPDYTKSLVEVYIDVVRYLINAAAEGKILEFLGYVIRPTADWDRLHQPDLGLPSWVPDWSGPKVYIEEFRQSLSYKTDQASYAASRDTRPILTISGHQLHLDGLLIDAIETTQPVASIVRLSDTSIQRAWLPPDGDDDYIAGGTVKEAYCHAIVADIGRPESSIPGYVPYVRGCAMDWSLLDESLPTNKDADRRNFLLDNLNCTTVGRRLFRTTNGYIGLGPAAAVAGDSVCMLSGGRLLYILRALSEGTYEFIGECYVHGLMDGEALVGFEQDTAVEHQITTFVLV
ncbi:hypothetical protein O1611_g4638 [Lasiodiplodia mahajangana]|uniref:Uncharacterized protein n=1 Tax=Lasiodiplodia mahajangana TaxID=1108764 RepID=A0ACC2JNR0_9PEZI|nr:hypothetical protein O1611_g4638 [Lasiodiplodia mahajangana]